MFNIKKISDTDDFIAWESYWRDYHHNPSSFVEEPLSLWNRLRGVQSSLVGILVYLDGKPIGFAHYRLYETTRGIKPECYLQDLYITPTCRKMGAASFVLDWFKEQAQSKGWSKVTLKTRVDNEVARKLYDRLCDRNDDYVHYIFSQCKTVSLA